MLSTTDDVHSHYKLIEQFIGSDKERQSALLYTGLRMAGSAHAWNGENIPEGVEDGILTSYEMSHIDLAGCELAVLSACETGLGIHTEWGGNLGLNYALKQAGVQTVVSSLWEVPDVKTTKLMQKMYSYISVGLHPRDALVKAQKEFQKMGYPPSEWAGFYVTD